MYIWIGANNKVFWHEIAFNENKNKSSFIHFSSKFMYFILILNSSKLNGGGGQGLYIKGRYLARTEIVFFLPSVKFFHDTHKLSIFFMVFLVHVV